MESATDFFMIVTVMVLSVLFANCISEVSAAKKKKQKTLCTFCLPCIATLAIGTALISDLRLLVLVVTASLLAGSVSLLVSCTNETNAKQITPSKVEIKDIAC
ncbi:MAG: hypothetical protein IIT68_06775 [Treponema sp.]|nr:hypothetical protein [Treponema sp.]